MRTYAWPFLAALALVINSCGSDPQPTTDGGPDGGGARGGSTGTGGRGGTGGGAGRGGTGGSTAGSGGSAAGTGGSTGTGGGTAGTGGGTGGGTAGTGGGTGGGTAGTGGGSAGTGGRGGTGGGTAGTGGSTAGTGGGTGGSTAGTGGGTGGSTAGTGGGTGGSTAGTGGGTGGSTAGTGGTVGTGGSAAGTGGSAAGTGGSAAGTGGSTGTGGTGGTGGSGVACTSASTCPGGTDTECQQKTCLSNLCGLNFTAANTVLTLGQATGDCKRKVCDGIGGVLDQIFDTDTPADEGNACTDETCVNGIATHPPEPARTACTGAGGATLCNGSSATPACVVCLIGTDCPGNDSICHTRVCGNQNTCGFSNAAAGTPAEADAVANCKKDVCDSTGGKTPVPDDTDLPIDDGNGCTDDICVSGTASHPTKADGTACTAPNGGRICSGAVCVQCITVANCPGNDSICRTRTCLGDHTCSGNNAPAGTAAEVDATLNCRKDECDGNGGKTSVADDTDKPVDGDACTSDLCTAGVPSNPDLPRGTLCAADGSKACDGTDTCNALTFRVVRVGTGTGALTSAAVAAFIEERRADGSLVGTPLALPTAAAGSNRPLTMVGNSTSEGHLSLSSDGHYVVLAGYPVAPGAADPSAATSATVNRVVGRVDAAGTVNTTTSYTVACSTNNARSVASTNGTEFWLAGAGSRRDRAASGTTRSARPAARGGVVRVVSSPGDVRVVAIFDNQLYGSSNAGTFTNVFSIGFGTPTTANQTATSFPGMPTSGASPYAYALFDLRGRGRRQSTRFTSRTGATARPAMPGVQKWTFNGTTWTRVAILNVASGTLPGYRGIAGYAVGQTVTLMASTFETSPTA